MADLRADSICSIIKACGESGVNELQYGNLHVTFGVVKQVGGLRKWPNEPKNAAQVAKAASNEEIQKQEEEIKNEFLQEMLISDPFEYEKLLEQGEINVGR